MITNQKRPLRRRYRRTASFALLICKDQLHHKLSRNTICDSDREREREWQTETETDRDTQRETETQRDKDRETKTERDREVRERERQRDRARERWGGVRRKIGRERERWNERDAGVGGGEWGGRGG